MTTNPDLERYKRIVEMGIANAEEQEIYRRLLLAQGSPGAGSPAAAPPGLQTPVPVIPTGDFIPLNTESFLSGGTSFTPPPKDGIYEAVCTGKMTPKNDLDQTWWMFSSLKGKTPYFTGVLVTAKLSAFKDSGAWKVLQVLDALDATYQVIPGQGAYVDNYKGKLCQVTWQWVEIRGVQQLRIQDVHKPGSVTESPV